MPGRTDTSRSAADDAQRRRLLDALADDTLGAIVAVLLRAPATQRQLCDATGVDQTLMSRSLKYLRGLGFVRGGRGKGAEHSIVARSEAFAVLKAADRLARAVNDALDAAQRESARATVADELRGGGEAGRNAGLSS